MTTATKASPLLSHRSKYLLVGLTHGACLDLTRGNQGCHRSSWRSLSAVSYHQNEKMRTARPHQSQSEVVRAVELAPFRYGLAM